MFIMFIVMNIKMKLGLTKFAIDLNRQGLIQDLNLSHGTNVVSFMRVTNAVGDPRYAGWGGGGLGEGRRAMLRMVSSGQETCILISFSTLFI